MAYALQQLINGITLGMIYGLIAVGYTMVYGIIGMINFAHGDVFMVGAFIGIIVLTALVGGHLGVPLGILAALIVSAALCALYGFSIERVAYRPLRGSFRLAPLISAIGMSILLENYVQTSQGALERAIPALIPGGITLMNENGFVVQLSWMQMAIVVADACSILTVFTYHRHAHAARPLDAGGGTGPEDGVAARHRHQPHHQLHLRAWARRWRPSPA